MESEPVGRMLELVYLGVPDKSIPPMHRVW